MKQVLVITLLGFFSFHGNAQTLKKTKELVNAKTWDKAKESIDLTIANPKLKKEEMAEAYYLKGKIYVNLAANPAFKSLVSNPRTLALEAFQKGLELDKNIINIQLTLDQYQPVIALYTNNFDDAAAFYNKENYAEAFTEFKNTAIYGDFLVVQGWSTIPKLDTTLVYYTALSAINSKNIEEAIKYFLKLADAKVGRSPEQVTIYRYLAKYYFDKKDEVNLVKTVSTGLALYPLDDYLPLLELDMIREKGDKVALYKKFEQLIQANPSNYDVLFEYGNELFTETHVSEFKNKPSNYNENCLKIEKLYTQAASVKPENFDVVLSLGKHFYNQAVLIEDEASRIRGTKPEDVKRKAELNSKLVDIIDKAIVPLDKVFNHYDKGGKLITRDKSNFKSACSLLIFCYTVKKDKVKQDFFQKAYDSFDTTH
jgi:tetratricopeptide (TPR) repeat protein